MPACQGAPRDAGLVRLRGQCCIATPWPRLCHALAKAGAAQCMPPAAGTLTAPPVLNAPGPPAPAHPAAGPSWAAWQWPHVLLCQQRLLRGAGGEACLQAAGGAVGGGERRRRRQGHTALRPYCGFPDTLAAPTIASTPRACLVSGAHPRLSCRAGVLNSQLSMWLARCYRGIDYDQRARRPLFQQAVLRAAARLAASAPSAGGGPCRDAGGMAPCALLCTSALR